MGHLHRRELEEGLAEGDATQKQLPVGMQGGEEGIRKRQVTEVLMVKFCLLVWGKETEWLRW